MHAENLITALNQLTEYTGEQLETLFKAKNAAIEMRMASLLMLVTTSELPIRNAALDLIVDLTCPEADREFGPPTETVVGKSIIEAVEKWPEAEPQLGECQHAGQVAAKND